MVKFWVNNSCQLEIRGQGKIITELLEYFSELPQSDSDTEADVICESWAAEVEPEVVYGSPDQYFGKYGEWFLIRDGEDFVALDESWTHIRTTSSTNHPFVFKLLEYGLRRKLQDNGHALVHGSGVKYNGRTFVFPGWRYTGKTNTMLTLLLDGGDYLGDDRVWLDGDGTVWGYPLEITMTSFNYDPFPGLSSSAVDRSYLKLVKSMDEVIDKDRSIVDKMGYFFLKFYLEPSQKRTISELIPEANYVSKSPLNGLIFLQTNPSKVNDGGLIREMDPEQAATELASISQFEWNNELALYTDAHDMIFQRRNQSGRLQNLLSTERDIFESLAEATATYRMFLPQESEWSKQNISSRILQELSELND